MPRGLHDFTCLKQNPDTLSSCEHLEIAQNFSLSRHSTIEPVIFGTFLLDNLLRCYIVQLKKPCWFIILKIFVFWYEFLPSILINSLIVESYWFCTDLFIFLVRYFAIFLITTHEEHLNNILRDIMFYECGQTVAFKFNIL